MGKDIRIFFNDGRGVEVWEEIDAIKLTGDFNSGYFTMSRKKGPSILVALRVVSMIVQTESRCV